MRGKFGIQVIGEAGGTEEEKRFGAGSDHAA